MQTPTRHSDRRPSRWIDRLDRVAQEMNVVLLVLAIGLAALDFTCFCAFKVRDALPSPARAASDPSLLSRPGLLVNQSFAAAVTPTRPSPAATGW